MRRGLGEEETRREAVDIVDGVIRRRNMTALRIRYRLAEYEVFNSFIQERCRHCHYSKPNACTVAFQRPRLSRRVR